jgi:Family of unknown function (DUF5723)
MTLMKKTIYSFLAAAGIIACCNNTAQAQYNFGTATSNWSGTNAIYLNPASIADSREKFSIDIMSFNAGVDNNLGYINSKGGIIGAINKGNTNDMFSYNNNKSFSLLAPYAQVHLPGFSLSINPKHSIALTTSIRGFNQFNNFDQSLYRIIADTASLTNGNLDLTSNRFNYTAQIWSEIGVTYAGVLVDNKESELRIGVTLRYLGGIGYLGLRGKNLDAHYKGASDSLFVNNSDLEFASNIVSTKSALLNGVSNHSIFSEFFGSKDGSGIGGDIGLIYDYMPNYERGTYDKEGNPGLTDYSKNRYKLRLSASVMDIGAITYKSSSNSNARLTGDGVVSGADLRKNVSNFDDFRAYALAHGFTADTSHKSTKVYMPTTLRIGADYNIYKAFYVNATYVANLANRQNFGNSYYNQLTVTPRFDTRLISVGLPITYGVLANAMKVGVGVRVSGFFIGSDDLLAFVSGHQAGVNFYAGGSIPFYKSKPRGGWFHKKVDTAEVTPEPDMEHGGSKDTLDDAYFVPKKSKKDPIPTVSETALYASTPERSRREFKECFLEFIEPWKY